MLLNVGGMPTQYVAFIHRESKARERVDGLYPASYASYARRDLLDSSDFSESTASLPGPQCRSLFLHGLFARKLCVFAENKRATL